MKVFRFRLTRRRLLMMSLRILNVFAEVSGFQGEMVIEEELEFILPENLARTSPYLTHPVFNTHHTEHEMLALPEIFGK